MSDKSAQRKQRSKIKTLTEEVKKKKDFIRQCEAKGLPIRSVSLSLSEAERQLSNTAYALKRAKAG